VTLSVFFDEISSLPVTNRPTSASCNNLPTGMYSIQINICSFQESNTKFNLGHFKVEVKCKLLDCLILQESRTKCTI
jgi:hypothetical protein